MHRAHPPTRPPATAFSINRRAFMQSASAVLASSVMGAYGVDLVQRPPRRVGLIGAGWYGKSDLWRLSQVAPIEITGICDVDRNMLEEAAALATQRLGLKAPPPLFKDYRTLLRETRPDIVLIGTPDHWHALPAIAAMEAGADVYLQKPIGVDVIEGEAILATARKLNRVVQIGTQRKSTPHLIEARERVVQAGLLGAIGHVDMCCYHNMRTNSNPPEEPVPDFLDYDFWTGPAPMRPYDGLPHKRWWRSFMEYGNGITGDMCVHMIDTVRWMLGLGWPRRVSAHGGIYVQKAFKSNIADTQTAVFDFDGLSVTWQHRTWGPPVDPAYPWAFFIYGDKGVLKASTMQADFIPRDKQAAPIHFDCVYEREAFPEDTTEKGIELNAAPATRRHMLDFLAAIDRRGRPVSDIEDGHISTASCILANMAMELGRTLAYDPARREIPADVEASRRLRRIYRAPWVHPEPT